MKWIIYFLLILNIAFAAWHFRGLDVHENVTADEFDINNESQLVLLSELKQYQANLDKFSKNQSCFSLGPFARKSDSEEVQRGLKAKNIKTKRIRLSETKRNGFWVILPSSKSRKGAKKYIRRLKKLKVEDFFLVATGPYENAVSLGVFSQKKLARKRVDEMIGLGFVPRMERVALARYWLNWYKKSKNQPDKATIRKIKKQYHGVSQINRSCK